MVMCSGVCEIEIVFVVESWNIAVNLDRKPSLLTQRSVFLLFPLLSQQCPFL